jgi:hypothetical protein
MGTGNCQRALGISRSDGDAPTIEQAARKSERRTRMATLKRPFAFWLIMAYLVFDLLFFLVGQTASLFAYDFTVRMGLQESVHAVGEYGVQVNRSFGLSDTVIGIPLMLLSLVGLYGRKRWALSTLAAFMGISIYWPVFYTGLFLFLKGIPGYSIVPGIGYGVVLVLHAAFGIWILVYLMFRGEKLVAH